METVSEGNFRKLVLECGVPALVSFCAPWCKFCSIIDPILNEIAADYKGRIRCFKVNADDEKDLASKQGVLSVPTLILYAKGKSVMRLVGFQSKKDIIEKVEKELDAGAE